jgi:hypothetical protein
MFSFSLLSVANSTIAFSWTMLIDQQEWKMGNWRNQIGGRLMVVIFKHPTQSILIQY